MATMSEIMVNLSMDMKDFNRQMNDVSNKTKKLGSKMQGVGNSMTKNLTVPLALVGGAVIKMGSDFEATMSKVEAVTGSNAGQMKKLEDRAKDLGATTKYSASEVAEGMSFLGMAGFKTEDILSSMNGMLDLATAGNLDLARASDIASNILTGFGLEASKSGHMADVLAYASSNANTNVEQLGEGMKYLAPTSKALGWTLEESTSAMMALADAGIQGGMAGQAFSTSLTRLAKPTKKMRETMGELGMSFFDAQGNMKSLPETLSMLEEKTKGMTKEQKSATLSTLFGAEAYKHWAVLLDAGSKKVGDNTEALKTADGQASKMADTMSNNLQGSFKEFKSAIEGTAISLYEILAPALKVIVEKLTGAVRWFNGLSEETKKTIMIVAGVVAGLGVLITILGSLIIFVGSVVSAIGTLVGTFGTIMGVMAKVRTALNLTKLLPLITSPVGLIVLAIAGLIAIGILVWKNWDTIKAKAIEIWTAISTWFTETLTSIKDWFSSTWKSVKDKTLSVFASVGKFLKEWGMKLLGLFPLGMLVLFFIKNWDEIKEFISITMDMIKALLQVAWNFIYGKIIKPVVENISKFISKAWNVIKDVTSTIFNAVKSVITSVWNAIYNVVAPIVSAIWNWIVSKFNAVKSSVTSIFNSVKSTVSSVWDSMYSKVSGVASNIYNKVRDKFNDVKDAIMKPINKAKDLIKDALDKIKGMFSGLKLEFPKPKIPSFSVSKGVKSIAGVEVPYPKVKLNWNATGNIFKGASLLGGNNVVGEAGNEVVMPIQHKRYMKPYANAVAEHLDEMKSDGTGGNIVNRFEVAELVVREEADVEKVAQKLYELQQRGKRQGGRR